MCVCVSWPAFVIIGAVISFTVIIVCCFYSPPLPVRLNDLSRCSSLLAIFSSPVVVVYYIMSSRRVESQWEVFSFIAAYCICNFKIEEPTKLYHPTTVDRVSVV